VDLVVASGIDVVEVARLARALERTPRLAQRIFTSEERRLAGRRVASLAGRFAAKEATLKALGVGLGGAPLAEIELLAEPSGAPRLVLGPTASRLAAERGWTSVSCSIAHERSVAVAVVVAVRVVV
jgi:holo-[acyl-carrier protein] synthase